MAETIVSLHAFYKGKTGGVDGFLSHPIAPGRCPAIVIGHEWFGLVDWSREFNRILAAEGFAALTPDLYHGKIAIDHETAARYKTGLDINKATQEIIDAVRALSEEVKRGALKPSEIDEKLFSRYLYTRDCPDPDILIRTSGEMRISNFLLWQISYAELYVTPKLWPDFNEVDLEKVIDEYNKRERRFGR